MGIVECDNMLMILAASTDMEEKHRNIVTRKMIEGFNEIANEAGVSVTGGQTVRNPWPIIGGVAMSTITEEEMIRPENAKVGDLLVLTKPLGTQLAVNLHQWILKKSERWENAKKEITEEEVMEAYNKAILSMSRLNKIGAKLLHKYKAHAATDVTGFGLLGHANNLALNQLEKGLCFQIDCLPIISKMAQIDKLEPSLFKLLQGFSSETSGGLLLCIPPENASPFVEEITKLDSPAWIVGKIVKNSSQENIAILSKEVYIIDV